MAYRKVDEASLTAVADAIREKGGTSDGLKFPDEMVAAIAAIETNGLPDGVSALATGTFTPASDITSAYSVNHGLGTAPNFVIVIPQKKTSIHKDYYFGGFFCKRSFGVSYQAFDLKLFGSSTTSVGASIVVISSSYINTRFGATSFTIDASSAPYMLKSGLTYRWIAGVVDISE